MTPEEKEIDRRFAGPVAAGNDASDLERARSEGRSLTNVALDEMARSLTSQPLGRKIRIT